MNNLKSAETAKQAILERIAQKLAASERKTTVAAVHSNKFVHRNH